MGTISFNRPFGNPTLASFDNLRLYPCSFLLSFMLLLSFLLPFLLLLYFLLLFLLLISFLLPFFLLLSVLLLISFLLLVFSFSILFCLRKGSNWSKVPIVCCVTCPRSAIFVSL